MGSHFVKTGLGNDAASAQYFDTPQQAFSQANKNLENANYAAPNFLAQKTDATVTPGDPSDPESAPSIQGGNLAPNFLSQPVNLPKIQTPSFLQAQDNPQLANKAETKMGKLFQILSGVAAGGAAGLGQRTVGAGFAAAQDSSIQRQQARQQQQEADLHQQQGQQQLQLGNAEIQMLPLKYQAAGLGLQKTAAETSKAEAEAAATPIDAELKKAQAAAAKYKEVNGVLYDVSGDKPSPVQGAAGQFIPADEKVAKLANIPVGSPLPVDTYKKLNDISNSGVQSVQAGGRSLLVDKQGNTIKDLGAATPVVVNNMQQGPVGGKLSIPVGATGDDALANLDPALAATIKYYGDGHGDLKSYLTRLNGQAKTNTIALLKAYNPNFSEATFSVDKKAALGEVPSKIGDQRLGFNTAISHAQLLRQAFNALNNDDNATLNKLKNSWQTAFGSGLPTSTQAIVDAYNHEVNSVVAKGHTTDKEIADRGATLSASSSPDTVDKVLGSYEALMQSKIQNLDKQIDKATGKKDQPPPNKHSDIGFVPLAK